MTDPQLPTESELQSFFAKVRAFRAGLPENEQKLLDAMAHAALGKREENEAEVAPYWVAVDRGVAVADPVVVAEPEVTTWAATPMGAVYVR